MQEAHGMPDPPALCEPVKHAVQQSAGSCTTDACSCTMMHISTGYYNAATCWRQERLLISVKSAVVAFCTTGQEMHGCPLLRVPATAHLSHQQAPPALSIIDCHVQPCAEHVLVVLRVDAWQHHRPVRR